MSLKKNFKHARKKLGIVLFSIALIVLTSCNSKGCYENMTVRLHANFYTVSNGEDVLVLVDSISVWGVGNDSLLYENKRTNKLLLVLNPNSDTTQFVVAATQNNHVFLDTLTVIHENNPWYQSLECGCMVYSKLKKCTTNGTLFKTVSITDSSVINLDTEHVKLYF